MLDMIMQVLSFVDRDRCVTANVSWVGHADGDHCPLKLILKQLSHIN